MTATPAGWGAPATTPTALPYLVSNAITCGQARILLLFLDSQNRVVSAPDRTASVAFYDLGRDPSEVGRRPRTARSSGPSPTTAACTSSTSRCPRPGRGARRSRPRPPGQPTETTRMTFDVHDTSTTVQVGQKAPASKTPTLADVGGDVTKISTDPKPNPAFYTTSVADAIAEKKPFILIFATPKFCKSAAVRPDARPAQAGRRGQPGRDVHQRRAVQAQARRRPAPAGPDHDRAAGPAADRRHERVGPDQRAVDLRGRRRTASCRGPTS